MKNKRNKQVLFISILVLIMILGCIYIMKMTSWKTYFVTSDEQGFKQILDSANHNGLPKVLDKIMMLSDTFNEDQINHDFSKSDFRELQNFLNNNSQDKRIVKTILSKNTVYFVDVVKDRGFYSFTIKPIHYYNYFTNNLNKLFLFRKQRKEILPNQIANLDDKKQTGFRLAGIRFNSYHRNPSVHFRYWPESKKIKLFDSKKEIKIKNIQVKMSVHKDMFWARSYVVDFSPTEYTHRLSNDINLSVSHSNHNAEIKFQKYLYDISIFSKSTNFVQLQKEESIHIHSSFGLKDATSVDYVTELITSNSENHSPSFYITAELMVEAY